MRKDDFVMRGKTASGQTEVLNFSGFKPGYAYKLVEFSLFPATAIGTGIREMIGCITAGKTATDPNNPDFNDEGLIATTFQTIDNNPAYPASEISVVNDTFLITQNLILIVKDDTGGESINWQCRFRPVKLAKAQEAVANYKQYMISDGS